MGPETRTNYWEAKEDHDALCEWLTFEEEVDLGDCVMGNYIDFNVGEPCRCSGCRARMWQHETGKQTLATILANRDRHFC